MRISDWSADVCSSDLRHAAAGGGADAVPAATRVAAAARRAGAGTGRRLAGGDHRADAGAARLDGAQQRLVSRGLSSEERRGGKECVSPRISRWAPYQSQKNTKAMTPLAKKVRD